MAISLHERCSNKPCHLGFAQSCMKVRLTSWHLSVSQIVSPWFCQISMRLNHLIPIDGSCPLLPFESNLISTESIQSIWSFAWTSGHQCAWSALGCQILDAYCLNRRVQYVIEGLFETRRKKFSDHPMAAASMERWERLKNTSLTFLCTSLL